MDVKVNTMKKSRKWLVTFDHVNSSGITHYYIKQVLKDINNLSYWCMCDSLNIVTNNIHTRLFLYIDIPVSYYYLCKNFSMSTITCVCGNGTLKEFTDYVRKQGSPDEIKLSHTFEDSVSRIDTEEHETKPKEYSINRKEGGNMTYGQVMFAACVLFVVVGTVGLIRDIKVKRRQRKQAKHYAAMRESAADNE